MNLLLFRYTTLGFEDLKVGLLDMGHRLSYVDYTPKSFEEDPILEQMLKKRLEQEEFDGVISFNYFQVISKICNDKQIKYISWVWDSPLLNLYSPTIHNPVNYIFIFDQTLYQSFIGKGVKTVYHLPLAVNTKRLDQIIRSKEDMESYQSEVSFVGRLYKNKISYDALTTLPAFYKGYLEAVMQAQLKIYGYNFLESILRKDIMEGIKSHTEFYLGDKFTGSLEKVIADVFLGIKITQMERIEILRRLSQEFAVDLYSYDDGDGLPNINHRGKVDYYTEMPKVFYSSKINLNITHRSIYTGIPLRVFDIMGAGGFVITNYQAELLDLFVNGEDLVIYESIEDLVDKVKYYLEHEEERERIALNGCRKVREYHTYDIRLKQIFELVWGD